MEIVQERLESEYDLDIVVTAPTVAYKIISTKDEAEILITDSAVMPDSKDYVSISEPYVLLEVISPSEYTGGIMEQCQKRRGKFVTMKSLSSNKLCLTYEIPMAEVITTLNDQIKSCSKGYASMSYHDIGYRSDPKLRRLDVKINGERMLPLSTIVHEEDVAVVATRLCDRLREVIPPELFRITIQACVGPKVVSSTSVAPLAKDVTAKLYGGDISRKKKLWEKQKKGKKRMKMVGKINIPQDAFIAILTSSK